MYLGIRATEDADARSSRVEKGFEGSREERCGFLGQDEHYGLLVSCCHFGHAYLSLDVQYRLLLGIDVESKHITCGLVDTIGKGEVFRN